MIRLLVLEDRADSRNALTQYIKEISDGIAVYPASSLKEADVLLKSENHFDAFLLDINLEPGNPGDRSGIEFARAVRSCGGYEFTPIIMMTSVSSAELQAYRELHCYQFLVKPYRRSDVGSLIKKLLFQENRQQAKTVMVKKDGINYKLNCSEIVFIKSIPRGICLHLVDESIDVPYTTIKNILGRLPGGDFFQCHRMYVVNRLYVETVDMVNRFIRLKGVPDPIEIGVTYKNSVRGWSDA